ncbi:putative transcriptional regulator [Gluconacetobacter sacchari DSM 12717]|uniref:Helix-turn-helix domain-containing protein n=2 Tax=Gluconacetobacter sacchari TaxID=92759 RepID=A0A7W4NQK1_9PROT|nr:helix-turn-helix domain-containing protein [Gluconacetobacter sacchari]MBB2162629.1 helix-turn-helix domain-containing protein [Gluconacetobacter sacchari]GBQ28701.1 putative transcriptional regulator [Gluconacetobacter sacchari DSM 12717]
MTNDKPASPPALTLPPPRPVPARFLRDYLRTTEVAELLGLSPRTLEKYRVIGEGPTFLKLGQRVLYARSDVEAWLQAHRCAHTSDDTYTSVIDARRARRREP